MIEEDKFILDVCCGGKAFWFNKNHPNTIYQDIRTEEKFEFCPQKGLKWQNGGSTGDGSWDPRWL